MKMEIVSKAHVDEEKQLRRLLAYQEQIEELVNVNWLQVHALAYNLFNWFRRIVLAADLRKQRIDTIRLKLLKIAARVIRSARYIHSSSAAPYKDGFFETLANIRALKSVAVLK